MQGGSLWRELCHLALLLSVGAAIGFRYLSDFSLSTVRHQVLVAGIGFEATSANHTLAVVAVMFRYVLQRDWFNLTPQALPEILGFNVLLILAYVTLRLVADAVAALSVALGLAMGLPILAILTASVMVAIGP